MAIPSLGFRHAATLLITQSARVIAAKASPGDTHCAVERLAHGLVELAHDMRVNADAIDWLTSELNTTVDRLPHSFDRAAAKTAGAAILTRIKTNARPVDRRDLFLIHAPQDRLPIAAPLAVELQKRRVSVALAGYEVPTSDEFAGAMAHGLAHHRGGVVIWTPNLEGDDPARPEHERVRVIRHFDLLSNVADLVNWSKALRVSGS